MSFRAKRERERKWRDEKNRLADGRGCTYVTDRCYSTTIIIIIILSLVQSEGVVAVFMVASIQ